MSTTLFDDPAPKVPTPPKPHPMSLNGDPEIEESWAKVLHEEFQKDYFLGLKRFIDGERKQKATIYPEGSLIFNAFDTTPFDKVKVVIIGQDPYHGPRQAHGLCFSVLDGVRQPPSLKNIFKELKADLDIPFPSHGNLESWAKQGVLLLNATLTVRASQAGSHQKKGWEEFTDAVIQHVSDEKEGIVFLLWGNYAQKKGEIIDRGKHHVLNAPHPSPLSVHKGFFGCKHFSSTNAILESMGKEPINWNLSS